MLFRTPDQDAGAVLKQATTKYLSTTPELVVCVPGMQPLTIACRDSSGLGRRFSWRGQVQQRVNEPADYAVSGADWLTLVEKFGLAPYLETRDAAGVRPDTPTAHLGLDSPAVTLANTLAHEFGVASPIALLRDGSTVADLAAVLTGGQPTQRQVDFAAEADR